MARPLRGSDGVVIANHNAPDQSVISGPAAAVAAVAARLAAAGARVRPAAGLLRLPLAADGRRPRARWPRRSRTARSPHPAIPVYGNATAAPYPATPPRSAASCSSPPRAAPVDFVGQVRRMYADGARVFVELGPGRVLTTLVGRILGEKPHTAVAFDAGGGLKGLLQSLGKLTAAGVEVDLQALFAGRQVRRLDFEEIARPVAAARHGLDGRRRTGAPAERGDRHHGAAAAGQRRGRSSEPRREAAEGRPAGDPASAPIAAAARRRLRRAAPRLSRRGRGAVSVALEAYRAYQETMRQFLALQENVMARILGGPRRPCRSPGVQTSAHNIGRQRRQRHPAPPAHRSPGRRQRAIRAATAPRRWRPRWSGSPAPAPPGPRSTSTASG